MVAINFTPKALEKINQIAEYISQDSESWAKQFVKRIFERTELLKAQPKLGRIVPELGEENIRELIFGNYRIVYRLISEEQIDVITVHHSAQRFKL